MAIQETMRQYPPVVFVIRYAFQDIKFKDMTIPKEINIQISIPIVQLNPDLWEADAHQFNPKRFAKGILWASTNPQAYMSFGVVLASVQVNTLHGRNVILLLIISKFSFSSHQHTIIPHGSGWLCILGTVLSSILEEYLDIQALSNFCEEIKTILTLFCQINCIRTCIMQEFFESDAWSFISVIVQRDYQFIALCSTCCNYTNTQAHYLSFSVFPDTV